ncbi:MAG: heat-inducible transcriptional repressor HrcA [Thiotrichales bacterium]
MATLDSAKRHCNDPAIIELLPELIPDPMLTERESRLLKSLIETHISEGKAVGSRTLARVSGLDVSAATIRNVMADLEEMGLISSTHTSSGRIPTPAGYRVFVDSMLQTKPINDQLLEQVRSQFETAPDSQSMVESASNMLSSITQLAGIVTLPNTEISTIEQIEFVGLSEKRVLAVLVLAHGEVQNRVLTLDREYSRSELRDAANYLTEHFAGLDLHGARTKLISELKELRSSMNSLMESAMSLGEQTLAGDQSRSDYVMVGQTHLMGYEELSDVEKLRKLFDSFSTKSDILHILDRCASADGMQIFIGQESGNAVLGDCSVVTAPYTIEGNVVGVLGVIGPTRMPYDRVIPIVDITARLLGAALNSR